MKQQDLSLSKEKTAASFKELSTASTELNSAADELSQTIASLEKLLKNLNLRVSAWTSVYKWDNTDEGGADYKARDLGYAHVDGKWCIAIRKSWGNYNHDDFNEETWQFADAPRWMCVDAVSKLPDLMQALIKRTVETTGNIKTKTAEAQEIVVATASAAAEIMTTARRPK